MAAFVQVGSIAGSFDPNQLALSTRLMRALQNQDTNADAELRKVLQKPTFTIQGTTDTNTAAASSPVINLSDQGVLFPANTFREIIVDVVAFNGSNRWNFVTKQRVLGGTDPTLQGPLQFLTDCSASYGFTTADGTTTTEDATSCIAPAWWDGASPVAGNVSSNAITIQWLGGNVPAALILPGDVQNFDAAAVAADSRVYQHGNFNATNGTTDVFVSDVATPTAANWSNGSVVRINAKVFPVMQAPVIIDTASTPDKVFIGALGISGDVVTWNIDVYVGDIRTCGPLV
jgi:hypothetical protein